MRTGLNVGTLGDLVFKSRKEKRVLLESIGLSQNDLKRAEEFVTNLPAIAIDLAIAEDTNAEQVKIPHSFFSADIRKEVDSNLFKPFVQGA